MATTFELEPFPGRKLAILPIKLNDYIKFKEIAQNLEISIIDARIIIDISQIVIAACATLAAERNETMLTRRLSTELLYRLSGSKNVSNSLNVTGLKEDTTEAFLVGFDMSPEQIQSMLPSSTPSIITLHDKVGSFSNMGMIRKAYKVPVSFEEPLNVLHYINNIISTKDL